MNTKECQAEFLLFHVFVHRRMDTSGLINAQEAVEPAGCQAITSSSQPGNTQGARPTAEVPAAALNAQPTDSHDVVSSFQPADIQKTGLNVVYDPGQGKAEAELAFLMRKPLCQLG
jgi:hypothetical protein